jgi:hypothetical protein
MREYAHQRGPRRYMIPVPVLTPRLSSLWLGLITPVYARIGRQLIDSIRHATVVQDDMARHVFPLQPMGVRQAIARALGYQDQTYAVTRWSDALSTAGPLVAGAGELLMPERTRAYGIIFMDGLKVKTTPRKHANVL